MNLPQYALDLGRLLLQHQTQLVVAESCTGGLVAASCTANAGASKWFDRGWVCYSNEAKFEMLGVDSQLIAVHDAVSKEVAQAMASGALSRAGSYKFAIAITGIAGPGGGTAEKPVGLVYFAFAYGKHLSVAKQYFAGGRWEVQQAATQYALDTAATFFKSCQS